MFKKGQLVKLGEDMLVVTHDEFPGGLVTVARLVTPESNFVERGYRLILVGNNYQAKPKCSR